MSILNLRRTIKGFREFYDAYKYEMVSFNQKTEHPKVFKTLYNIVRVIMLLFIF